MYSTLGRVVASNTAEFNVAAPGENPTPTIAGISPSQTLVDVATADQLTLLITSTNFIGNSQAQWNGANRPTSYVNATTLKMLVTAADLALGGQGSITVENPGAGRWPLEHRYLHDLHDPLAAVYPGEHR